MNNNPNPQRFVPFKSWAEDDRPREKLLKKGKSTLSDAELLAILLNTGSRNETVVDLAKRLLAGTNNDLITLSRMTVKELTSLKGIGEAKAVTIAAALELGKRRRESEARQKTVIGSSKDAYEILAASITDIPHEEFWILLLNRQNHLIKKHFVSSGGMSGTVADQRLIFKKALEESASGIILAHNHPSGSCKPSRDDISLTKKLKEAGKIMDIPILDHIIVTDTGYYSFADEGIL